MKAAVFEYAWSENTILSAADRDVIMTQDRPPASVQVRLAAIESEGTPLRARGLGYVDNATSEKIICLTLTIGCLVDSGYRVDGSTPLFPAARPGMAHHVTPGAPRCPGVTLLARPRDPRAPGAFYT